MIQITPEIAIDEGELQWDFVRSAGPGGQNVNKVSTAVQVRFNPGLSSMPPEIRERLHVLAGRRLNEKGEIIITARRFRTQAANREDALNRLTDLIRRAAEKPEVRVPTKPPRSASIRRLEAKRHRSSIKQSRRLSPEAE